MGLYKSVGVAAWLGTSLACSGGAEAPTEPALKPVELTIGSDEPPPPPPQRFEDQGPAGVPQGVVEATAALFPNGRWVRCEVPAELAGEGALDGRWIGPELQHLQGITLADGWLTAVVPVDKGIAVVHRGRHGLVRIAWQDAGRGGWTPCTLTKAARYPILGLVQNADTEPVPGAVVRGCEPGERTQANEAGRFEVQGVADMPCPLVAFVEEDGGLRKSEDLLVVSDGAETIVEITIPPERLEPDRFSEQAGNLSELLERSARNTVVADRDGLAERVAGAELSPAARAVAERWVADLTSRVDDAMGVVERLKPGTKEALTGFWLEDF